MSAREARQDDERGEPTAAWTARCNQDQGLVTPQDRPVPPFLRVPGGGISSDNGPVPNEIDRRTLLRGRLSQVDRGSASSA